MASDPPAARRGGSCVSVVGGVRFFGRRCGVVRGCDGELQHSATAPQADAALAENPGHRLEPHAFVISGRRGRSRVGTRATAREGGAAAVGEGGGSGDAVLPAAKEAARGCGRAP